MRNKVIGKLPVEAIFCAGTGGKKPMSDSLRIKVRKVFFTKAADQVFSECLIKTCNKPFSISSSLKNRVLLANSIAKFLAS